MKEGGFTLIEVIIALAIVAIALAAASRAATLTLDSANDARRRVLAGLAVDNHAADLRLAKRAGSVGTRTLEVTQADQRLVISEITRDTPNPLIKRVDVSAAGAGEPHRALASVSLYLPVASPTTHAR